MLLNSFVGLTTSLFSASYIEHELETGRLTPTYLRFYHALYQTMLGAMGTALLANNIGLMWVAVEVATITTVLMVGVYRTPEALEAAWKYFILGSVGIALAFFGTILVYLAAQEVIGEGLPAMAWSRLMSESRSLRPGSAQPRLRLPAGRLRHEGRPGPAARLAARRACRGSDADLGRAVGPAAQRGTVRRAALQDGDGGQSGALAPGPLMITMGLTSLLFAALMLYRRRDIKRLFAYSSIEHMGIITFAFGMGGPLANFAGLLHMTMHSLTKSAIFMAVGHIAQVKGTQRLSQIRGLGATHPLLAWGLAIGVIAIAGLPPMGVFMSEFLVVTSTFARQPLLAIPLVLGLLTAMGALILRLQGIVFGPATGATTPVKASYVPLFAHLGLVLVAGLWLPPPLVRWFESVAAMLG